MPCFRRLAPFLLALPLAAGCEFAKTSGSADRGPVLAVVDGQEIREADLTDWIKDDMYREATSGRDRFALHELRSRALESMIDDQLVSAEARRRGVEPDALQAETAAGVSVTDAEVRAFFEANKERAGNPPFEQVEGAIREHLLEQAASGAWSAFVAGLRSQAAVDVAFEPPRMEVEATGPARGAPDAKVTIVAFSDYQCPYCQRAEPVLKELLERYPQDLRIVHRHFPLDRIHPQARAAAEAAACADEQGGFWAFHDRIFELGGGLPREGLEATASELGLDAAAFQACLDAPRPKEAVQRDVEAGMAAGVTGTPAFFVNGIPISGAQAVEAFVRVIDRELARGGAPPPTS